MVPSFNLFCKQMVMFPPRNRYNLDSDYALELSGEQEISKFKIISWWLCTFVPILDIFHDCIVAVEKPDI